MVKCLETLWQILVNDEDILVVMLLSTMRLLVFGRIRQLDLEFCLLNCSAAQSVRLVGLESQSDDQRGSKADIRCKNISIITI